MTDRQEYDYWRTDGLLARTPVGQIIPIELYRSAKGIWERYTDVGEFAHNSQQITPEQAQAMIQKSDGQ